MFRSLFVFVAAISLLFVATACSDDTEQPAKDAASDLSSGRDAAPPSEGGGGGDTGTPMEAAAPGCRIYGIEGTLTIGSKTSTITGSFDTTTLERKGEVTGDAVNMNTVDTYASVADFVDEVSAVGRQLLTKKVQTGDVGDSTTTFTYDASKRLIKREQTEGVFTYTAWDSEGRPTTGSADLTKAGCTVEITIVYDDQARTMTTTYHDPTSTCLSEDRKDQQTYDANGDWVGQVMQMGTANETTVTIAYTKTTQICK